MTLCTALTAGTLKGGGGVAGLPNEDLLPFRNMTVNWKTCFYEVKEKL